MKKNIIYIIALSSMLMPALSAQDNKEKQSLCDSTKAILYGIGSVPLLAVGVGLSHLCDKRVRDYHLQQIFSDNSYREESLSDKAPKKSKHAETLIACKYGLPATVAVLTGIALAGTGIYYAVKNTAFVAKIKEKLLSKKREPKVEGTLFGNN